MWGNRKAGNLLRAVTDAYGGIFCHISPLRKDRDAYEQAVLMTADTSATAKRIIKILQIARGISRISLRFAIRRLTLPPA